MAHLNTKSLVEGSLLLALFLVLSILPFFIPALIPALILVPIPIVIVTYRQSIKISIMVVFLSFIALTTILGNPIYPTLISLIGGLPGIVLGYTIKRKKAVTTLLVTTISFVASIILILNIFALFFDVNLVEATLDRQLSAIESIGNLLSGVVPQVEPDPNDPDIEDFRERIYLSIQMIFPALVIILSAFAGYINLIVSRLTLVRLGYKVESLPPFSRWRFGDWVLWTFVATLLMHIFGLGNIAVQHINSNVHQIVLLMVLIQGLAVAYWFLSKHIKYTVLKAIILMVVAIYPFTAQFIIMAGTLDFIINFRRI
ncbi:DUF2232 domain-containing protein [Proteinivorax hydrogeniformans]|uniref:DUF2232 domain-containing protein n=1 Tax=Proteinivorax hydrogeniformans TaxID=1826727 RepID=A0AAU8HT21_9FIRM